MIFWTNTRIALDALRSARTRTYLTMLGIIIGVASITLILALGEGLKQAVASQVNNLNNNLIVVRPGANQKGILNDRYNLNYSPLAPYATTTLTEADYKKLSSDSELRYVAPLMLVNGSIRYKKTVSDQSPILATTPQFADALKLGVTSGQFLDEDTDRDTVVLGHQLAIDLYGSEQPIGEQLKIRGRTHTVIGVLKKNSGALGVNGIDLNNGVIVSLEDGKSFNQGIAQIQQVNIVPKGNNIHGSIKKVESTLFNTHMGEKDFSVLSGQDAAVISRGFYQLTTSLTAIVASISLVVGGIGIMNIMLVSVAERTREIGVRKSLGASNRHIMWQFLIEALIMSITGGVVGIIVAYILASFIGLMLGFFPAFNPIILLITFGLSVSVGALFGLMPAMRAARKDPIEALRQNS